MSNEMDDGAQSDFPISKLMPQEDAKTCLPSLLAVKHCLLTISSPVYLQSSPEQLKAYAKDCCTQQ
jgi:hypothetical protein